MLAQLWVANYMQQPVHFLCFMAVTYWTTKSSADISSSLYLFISLRQLHKLFKFCYWKFSNMWKFLSTEPPEKCKRKSQDDKLYAQQKYDKARKHEFLASWTSSWSWLRHHDDLLVCSICQEVSWINPKVRIKNTFRVVQLWNLSQLNYTSCQPITRKPKR
jgi:hypothetical protein